MKITPRASRTEGFADKSANQSFFTRITDTLNSPRGSALLAATTGFNATMNFLVAQKYMAAGASPEKFLALGAVWAGITAIHAISAFRPTEQSGAKSKPERIEPKF